MKRARGIGIVLAVLLTCLAATSAPAPRELEIVLTPEMSTCSCKVTVTFTPHDGTIKVGGVLVAQIVWRDPDTTPGPCDRIENGCIEIEDSECKAEFEPLTVSFYNSWSMGKWIKATGLQSGNKFFYDDDDDVVFDPEVLKSKCSTGNPTDDSYKIEFFDTQDAGSPTQTFTITMKCLSCTTDADS